MSAVLDVYNKCTGFPFGKILFSKLVCFKAPYFSTIKPRFTELRPGYGEIYMSNRRSVQNHLKSVHALAMRNLCELVAGTTLDATLPVNMRWIPKSMNIEYLRIAKTGLKAVCEISNTVWNEKKDVPVTVSVTDAHGAEVVRATIQMHVSIKKMSDNS